MDGSVKIKNKSNSSPLDDRVPAFGLQRLMIERLFTSPLVIHASAVAS
jgi:hypothetical protein